ncbi:MAG: YraN family protein [Legionella sp.]|jgi:putative endonuclease
MHLEVGRNAEEQALAYLAKHGLKLVQRNYYCRMGEVDLIMRDGDYLVFIEVRSRSNQYYGDGAVSITRSKQQKIMKTALHYVQSHRLQDKVPLRFDVLSVDGATGGLNWIKNAFGADY